MDWRELRAPLALLAIGLLVPGVVAFVQGGASGWLTTMIAYEVALLITVILGIVALFVAAALFSLSFGDARSAAIKLAAVFSFPGAIAMLVPLPLLALGVALVLYVGLLAWLFELDFREAAISIVVIMVVRFVGALVAGVLFAAAA